MKHEEQTRNAPVYGALKISEFKGKCKDMQKAIKDNTEGQLEESVKVFRDTMLTGKKRF